METKIELFLSLSELKLLICALDDYQASCSKFRSFNEASFSLRIKTYLNRQMSYFISK